MASVPISGLTALSAQIAETDLLVYVDVSDTSQAPTGTTKKMTRAQANTAMTVATSLTVTGTVAASGNVDINTNKFNINATTGNTSLAGTFQAAGAITALDGVDVTGTVVASGAVTGASLRTVSADAAFVSVTNTAARNVCLIEPVSTFTGGGSADDAAIASYGAIRFYPNNGTTERLTINTDGSVVCGSSLTITSTTMLKTAAALTNGAGAFTGTLTNAPANGNPTKWVPIDDNGTVRYLPAW